MLSRKLIFVVTAALLASCTTTGTIPNTTQANLNANTLQFAVGTANIGQDGVVGVNFVATLRQPNGLTGVLAGMPTITGPAGFTVPAAATGAYPPGLGLKNLDAGTNHLSGSPQVPQNNKGLVNTTFGTFTGVFSYGLGPFNSDQNTTNVGAYYPGNPNSSGGNGFTSSTYDGSSMIVAAVGGGDPIQPLPFFSADPMDYIMGPPAVPFFNDGTWPTNFAGYSPGFTPVEIAATAGTYTMSIKVAAQNAAQVTYTKSATLTSVASLPAMPAPVFTSDAAGGGSVSVTIPAGVTETMVYVADASAGLYFGIGPVKSIGPQVFVLPDHLGKCIGSGCQNGASATPSMSTGDKFFVSAVGFDYPAFESGPPGNKQQNPPITGANGQADITMSPVVPGTY